MKPQVKPYRSITGQITRDYLFVSLVPVLLVSICMVGGALFATQFISDLIGRSTQELNGDTERQLETIGQQFIQSKAHHVAGEVDIFLQAHPSLSPEHLQREPELQRIALQQVGDTGYTCLYEAQTGIMRIHPNPDLVNRDMAFLAERLPAWWAIFEPSLTGTEVSGYYDWLEADGSIRRKYMTMVPVGRPFQGKRLMVAATTYIDEFSKPMTAMKQKAGDIAAYYDRYIARQGMIIGSLAVGFLVLTFAGVYAVGRRAALRVTHPIEQLADAARQLGKGRWNADAHKVLVGRNDEIGDLAGAFNHMQDQLKGAFKKLEGRVEELNAAQKALQESEAHYRSLFDGVPVGLYRTAPDGTVLSANPMLTEMLGYTGQEAFQNCRAENLWADPEERTRWRETIETHGAVHGYEIRMRKKDGSVIWAEMYARVDRDARGNVLHYEGSLKDISERKAAEAALRENERKFRELYETSRKNEELYRSLLTSSADAVVVYDMEGSARYVSPSFTRIFGWSQAEVKGQRIPFVPDAEKNATLAIIQDLVENGTPCQGFETQRFTKDGRTVAVNISASRYEDHQGRPAGMLVILRDISEKKKLEVQLQHAQRMESIGTLAGGIAHDFNNLMMGIQGNISLIAHNMDPSHPFFPKLKNMEKNIERGARLTSQLLGYARQGRYEISRVDMNRILRESAETFGRTRKDITIEKNLANDLLSVEADRNQMEQVFMNLFVNAADAMPTGGDLTLLTRNVHSAELQNKPYTPPEGRYVMIAVQDTGEGMDDKTLERIFDPFFTTKTIGRGTGLGLASVYGIVKAHGGYIDAESQIGSGSRFTIYLPAQAAAKRSGIRAADANGPPPEKKGTILLVDDEDLVVDVGMQMIDKLGFEVVTAGSGEEAIAVFKAQRSRIDLVILDMIMPKISGGEVYDRLVAMDPDVKVLLSSGYSIDGQAEEILKRGCNGFIQKPFNMDQLSEKIASILGTT